jgi:hypothetical protein
MRKRGLMLKSTLFYFEGYTRYCGDGIWNATCITPTEIQNHARTKTFDI